MMKRGFTLVENVIAVAIFVLLAGVIYQTSNLLIRGVRTYRENIVISGLASEYMEIVHNLPYSKIGTVGGNPPGPLPDYLNMLTKEINSKSYQIYYFITFANASNDYKQIKLQIKDPTNDKIYSFLTDISPLK